ncbi:MAG: hypothetical protein IID45_10070, partial [Planctomycetes bacterium]|nr:hypothetical protein [Planctomycetota bacterium]
MSSTTEVNRVRERVLKLAREIEQLSKSNVPPEEFFPKFLQMLVGALGAQGGAVWTMADGNRLNVAAEIGLANTGILEDPQAGFRNQKMLTEVM